jgi:hypothetical protein
MPIVVQSVVHEEYITPPPTLNPKSFPAVSNRSFELSNIARMTPSPADEA